MEKPMDQNDLDNQISELKKMVQELTQERNEWKKFYFYYRNKYELTRGSLEAYAKGFDDYRAKLRNLKKRSQIELSHPEKSNTEKVNALKRLLNQY